MPKIVCLSLRYNAYSEIKVPRDHAEKLQNGDWKYYVRWGTIHYTDDEGRDYEIEGTEPEVMCKYPEEETWEEHDIEKETQELFVRNKKAAEEAKARTEKERAAQIPTLTVSEKKIADSDSDALSNQEE